MQQRDLVVLARLGAADAVPLVGVDLQGRGEPGWLPEVGCPRKARPQAPGSWRSRRLRGSLGFRHLVPWPVATPGLICLTDAKGLPLHHGSSIHPWMGHKSEATVPSLDLGKDSLPASEPVPPPAPHPTGTLLSSSLPGQRVRTCGGLAPKRLSLMPCDPVLYLFQTTDLYLDRRRAPRRPHPLLIKL